MNRWGALLALALALRPARARAEPDAAPAAQALVEAGLALVAEGRLEEACPKFREAARIAPPGLAALKQLADCYEKAGRSASAWTTWREAEAGARRAGQEERAADAHQRAAALEPGLARLAIEVPADVRGTPGLEVVRDGAAIGQAQWGVAVPVDPGRHVIVATAPAREPWEVSLDVGGSGKLTILVPALRAEEAKPSLVASPVDPGRGRRTAGLVVGGAGLATLAAAILVQVLASNDLGACPDPNACDGSAAARYDAGRREQFGADALYLVGGASLVAGVVLYATAPRAPALRATIGGARWTALAAPGAVFLEGEW